MGTLTCKIRQRVQKLLGEKSRCFAQKQRKLESFKIRVPSLRGSFNQRARDSSSLERTKKPRRFVRVFAVFSVPESLHTAGADIENAIIHCYNKIVVLSPKIQDAKRLRLANIQEERMVTGAIKNMDDAMFLIPTPQVLQKIITGSESWVPPLWALPVLPSPRWFPSF